MPAECRLPQNAVEGQDAFQAALLPACVNVMKTMAGKVMPTPQRNFGVFIQDDTGNDWVEALEMLRYAVMGGAETLLNKRNPLALCKV